MIRAWVGLVVLVLCASRAHADEPSPQIKAAVLFEQAQADYEAGKYQAAIELFQRAYELVHDPVYLFNLAQSYRKVLDCEQATVFYKRYLDESPDAANKAKVQQWLVELEPCVERAQKEHEAARKLDELERQKREDDERRRREAAKPHDTVVDAGGTLRIAGYSAAGVGAVGFAVGIVYSIAGGHAKSDLAAKCKTSCNWDDPSVRALDSDGKHDNTMATIGWIGGGVALAAGVALYYLGYDRVEHVTIAPAPGGATVGARLSF
ncbi:MAG TPA: tetratricopeptide repeat protein [Kofleriaceae bacterium]|nr:tetratricopeptide repeat protein [Kofleriaceae bacterium]